MSLMSEFKERAARPAQDDDAYSGSSYVSDEYTLPGDSEDDDVRSIASVSSYESYDSFCPRERLPSYRVPKEQGTSQPVYEAWVLCMSHENDHEVTKLTSCGIDILSTHDEERPFVVSRTETYEQQELSDMTLASVNSYHAATKRGFAARLFRGKPKTYEQDLDERLRKLPVSLQSNLNGLLRNREEATSNRFRRRDWTVVMMREQYRYRFANATPELVKKKSGLWKGKDTRRVEYLFVIRGAEGRVAADDKGMYQPREFGNPWKRVDEEERQLRERSRDIRRFGKGYVQDGWFPRPRGRSLSPMPNAPGPMPRFQDYPRRPREVVTVRERGRPYSPSRSRNGSRSRSRSPSYPPPPMRNECLPSMNPFVPLTVPMGGMMPPLPPTPGPYLCPTPQARFVHPPYVPAGSHLPPFGLPPFEPPCMRSQLHHGPPDLSDLAPEPCTWPQPLPRSDQLPIPFPAHHTATGPYPFEVSSPPQSPRVGASFHCMGGAPTAPPPPPGVPTMEACHRLFDAEFPHDSDDEDDEDEGTPQSGTSAPPPPPKPSNLTTPTEFSPASSHHTGSTVQSTDGPTTPGGPGMEVFWE